MAKLGEISITQSNVIAYETLPEYGFCREYADGNLKNDGTALVLGSLVYDNAGVWTPLTDAQVTATAAVSGTGDDLSGEKFGIVIGFGSSGEAIEPEGTTATEDGMVLVQGIAMLRKEYLQSGTTGTATTANIKTIVEANMTLVRVEDSFTKFSGTYSNYS